MTNSKPESFYRADIDGLRAISALVIFIFHLGVSGFDGGYVGVDIFFVISGFLIIPKIVHDLEAGDFSLKIFFEKRIRRILPPLLLVLFASSIAAFFILGPREFEEFASSGFATLAFGANFFFADRSDYFADVSHQKPLLHAWSLSVEEQFYILMPLILMGLYWALKISPRKTVIVITVLSLGFNLYFINVDESKTFYFPMSRFWELGVGGILGLYLSRHSLKETLALLLSVLGLALIILTVVLLDDSFKYPGWYALLPVSGALLVIAGGYSASNPLNRFLGTSVFRYFGRISYTIYLIHWPVIVFVRLYQSRPLEPLEQIVIFVFAIVWAHLSWRFLESRMLSKAALSFKKVGALVVMGLFACLSSFGFASYTDGAMFRMSDESLAVIEDVKLERKRIMRKKCEWGTSFGGDGLPDKYGTCSYGARDGRRILLWGDSHMGMFNNAFNFLYGGDGNYITSTGMQACPSMVSVSSTWKKNAEICPVFVQKVIGFLEENPIELVVLGSRWGNLASEERAPGNGGRSQSIFDLENGGAEISFEAAMKRTIRRIKKTGADVLIIGPVPEIEYHVPDTLIRTLSGVGKMPTVHRADFDKRQRIVLEAFKKIEEEGLATLIYPHDFLCDENACKVNDGNKFFYTDDDHLSILGATPIVAALKEHF